MDMSGYLYTASNGESFDSIARELFDDEKYAAELMQANPEHDGVMIFNGGEMLRIPDLDLPDEDDDDLITDPDIAPWRR